MTLENFDFQNPWLLLLAIPALFAVWWNHRARRPVPSVVFPTLSRLSGVRPTWRLRLRPLVPALQALGLVALVIALARPRQGDVRTRLSNRGIAIQMVLDRSSSMEEKMDFEGVERRRIEIVKEVFREFIGGEGEDSELRGRQGDLVGLTTFARFTEENCPLVSDHDPLLTSVANLKTVPPAINRYGQQIPASRLPKNPRRGEYERNPLDGTAIGDGLHRAVLSLVAAEEDLRQGRDEESGEDDYEIQSKIIILLTDGDDNASELKPVPAGRLALENDIKVYYILLAETAVYAYNPFTGTRVVRGERSREELLATPRQVAGAKERAFLATDGDSLRRIYEEIDRLEKTEFDEIEYRSYNERFRPFVLAGFGCLLVAFLLSETLLRKMP